MKAPPSWVQRAGEVCLLLAVVILLLITLVHRSDHYVHPDGCTTIVSTGKILNDKLVVGETTCYRDGESFRFEVLMLRDP